MGRPADGDRRQTAAVFALLLADVVALLLWPTRLTAVAVVLVTGLFVLATQVRALLS